jgi:poly(A) polymerase
MKGVAQPPQFHPEGDVFVHTHILLLEKLPRPSPMTLAWGALLHDVGKPATFRVADRILASTDTWKLGSKWLSRSADASFSNHDTEQILGWLRSHAIRDVQRMKESTLKKFMRHATILKNTWNCIAGLPIQHGDLTSYEFTREKLVSTPEASIASRHR